MLRSHTRETIFMLELSFGHLKTKILSSFAHTLLISLIFIVRGGRGAPEFDTRYSEVLHCRVVLSQMRDT